MTNTLDELKSSLVAPATISSTARPPQWLSKLLESTPGLPSDVVPHNRPRHADLQGIIAAASYHPALEACLHLINGDLYSAHFLVRKAQGGSRYLDWLHAILHKLEGDYRNAKMWYTDLGNNNAGAGSENKLADAEAQDEIAHIFGRFHEFWFVSAANGGTGERQLAKGLNLDSSSDLPRQLYLTAHGHTDLVFLTMLAQKATSTKAHGVDLVKRKIEQHHSTTTLAEDKIKDSQSAFSLEELEGLYENVRSKAVASLMQLELVWMLAAMVQDFGWREYGMAETVEALKIESTRAHQSVDDDRKGKASNMVLNPGQGQRRF